MLAPVILLLMQVAASAQIIGAPQVTQTSTSVTATFQVTNGASSTAYFSAGNAYTLYLSGPTGSNLQPVGTFYPPQGPAPIPGASATIIQQLDLPPGTVPGSGYVLAVGSAQHGVISGHSQTFALNPGFTMPVQLNGAIKCQSPAITYYTLTLTNTGHLTDSYSLTASQSLYLLGFSFLSLSGDPISSTPQLDPGESYTMILFFETPNGTPPDNWNTTIVTATSNLTGIQQTTNVSTYIYCGNNNSNLPNAPDMEVVKTASTVNTTVGNYIDYTITIRNLTTKNAQNPVIKDFIPANADLVSYHKNPADPRNVTFNFNPANRTLSALVQTTMTSASMPFTIYVRVLTTCESIPMVTNAAEVFSVSGDTNNDNDTSYASTAVSYSLQAAQVGRWTGNFSSDWFDCRNWSGGIVPNNSTHVTLPANSPLCVISALSPKAPADLTARCFNLTIDSQAQLQMADGGLLAIAGDWWSNGNFSPGDGTVIFMGWQSGVWQNIADQSGSVPFYNLTTANAAGAKGIGVPDALGVFVHNVLSLGSGDIRLFGKSQLVQTADGTSANPLTGSGKLLTDQQGQSNYYSYNYWSSPVGEGNSYSVGNVLYDGTEPHNPQPVNWISGYNGSPTSPISLSPFWINKYQNGDGAYASWSCILQTGILSAGQGYTMKGSGTTALQQNYTFVGKPNNGEFTSTVSANNMNLSGNPYPCALDAHAFINDNLATTTGTLYFWEQFTTNSSHITANYEGGYATINLTGAAPPVAPAGISTSGSSQRTPGRFVPIGQGFLLFGSETGGTITFRNSQRGFVLESDTLSNAMFRSQQDHKQLRLQFTSASANIRRELLLAYKPGEATSDFDPGYDAIQIDTKSSDAYFQAANKNLVIQALGAFDREPVALGVQVGEAGPVHFTVSQSEGLTDISLYDSQTGKYHDLTGRRASLYLEPGSYHSRFYLTFERLKEGRFDSDHKPMLFAREGYLHLLNEQGWESVTLLDLSGRIAAQWEVPGDGDTAFVLGAIAPGTYLAKLSGASNATVKVLIP